VSLFKTATGQKSIAYHGAYLWNNLESEVKKAPSVSLFKDPLWYPFLSFLSAILGL